MAHGLRLDNFSISIAHRFDTEGKKRDCAPDCKQRRYLRPNQCEEVGGVDDGEAVVQAKSASVGLVAAAGEGRGS